MNDSVDRLEKDMTKINELVARHYDPGKIK